MLAYYTVKTFLVTLRVIPRRLWSPLTLTKVNFLSLPAICGSLNVDLKIVPTLKDAFKTAHSGSVIPNEDIPSSLSSNVCVKQVYFSGPGGVVKHYSPMIEQDYIHSKMACLDWLRIFLDLTYQFIEENEGIHEEFPGIIPKLYFVKAAMADCDVDKFFLIEEWIDTSGAPFIKYINNTCAVSCIPHQAPVGIQNIANFLCFAQHVQYQVTSDDQGMSQTVNAGISN